MTSVDCVGPLANREKECAGGGESVQGPEREACLGPRRWPRRSPMDAPTRPVGTMHTERSAARPTVAAERPWNATPALKSQESIPTPTKPAAYQRLFRRNRTPVVRPATTAPAIEASVNGIISPVVEAGIGITSTIQESTVLVTDEAKSKEAKKANPARTTAPADRPTVTFHRAFFGSDWRTAAGSRPGRGRPRGDGNGFLDQRGVAGFDLRADEGALRRGTKLDEVAAGTDARDHADLAGAAEVAIVKVNLGFGWRDIKLD